MSICVRYGTFNWKVYIYHETYTHFMPHYFLPQSFFLGFLSFESTNKTHQMMFHFSQPKTCVCLLIPFVIVLCFTAVLAVVVVHFFLFDCLIQLLFLLNVINITLNDYYASFDAFVTTNGQVQHFWTCWYFFRWLPYW